MTNSSNRDNQNSQNKQCHNYTNKQNKSEKNLPSKKEALPLEGASFYLIYLFAEHFAEAHEDRGDLGAGGVRLRAELAVRALNQALADGPLHRVDGPRTDVGSVRKLGQILRA